MPALNVIKRFAPDVESGKKRCTIRRAGKRLPPKVGDLLSLYTGMRTKYCRLLRREKCTEVTPVFITFKDDKPVFMLGVIVGTEKSWIEVGAEQVTKLAIEDGFKSDEDFFDYFLSDTDEFYGFLIEWEPTGNAAANIN